jgi:phospholipase/carboxylesterase
MTQNTTPLVRGAALQNAAVVCVVAHGRGQSPEQMDEHIIARLSADPVAYILPRAASGSWYDARAVDPLTAKTSAQLATSLDQLKQAAALAPRNVPLVMAGFSQGACLTLEYGFAFGPWHGGMVSFTGCRVGVPNDPRPHSDLNALPVYLTGADQDPWIPLPAHANAALDLAAARARLRTDVFPGRAHEVSDAEVSVLNKMLNQLASGREVQW